MNEQLERRAIARLMRALVFCAALLGMAFAGAAWMFLI